MRRRDVTLQYDTKVNDKGRVRCNFCNKEMGGGIYRLKEHLAWVKEKPRKMISIFWYTNALSFNSASSDFYPQMVASIAEARPDVCWPGTGVTIMTDGWKDKSDNRHLVNFLIGCPKGIVYHSGIDLSRKRYTGRLICAHLDKIVDEVGPENVVQVVTDIAVNYIKAGLFIYNHTYLHALMREHCMREIVKESTTRFATAFLTIQSILVNKAGLRAAMSQLGRQVETTLLDRRFWALYNHVVSVTEPLVRVLRLSDSDDKPAIGFLLNAIGRAREAIFDDNIWNEEILEIIDRRWRDQLHEDIHANKPCAWLFFNPQNLYSNATLDDADIMEGERNCIYRLEPDLETQMEKKHIRRTPTDYTPINLDHIFRRDLADEWVSLRTPILDQDFLNKTHDDETDGIMENNWQEPVIQECEGAQHDVVPDEQEDLIRLAWEEVQALRYRSYSRRERRSRSRRRKLVIHDDNNIEDADGHNTKHGGGNTEQGASNTVGVTQNMVGESMKAGRV
ncbi:hypothetical protein AMTRI_Chr10g229780 [Amborella trichopoda]